MEFARVTFPRVRGVNVDGAPMGQTGDLLRLQAGTHLFDLAGPLDYTPPSQTLPVVGTTPGDPLIVAFDPVMAAVAGPAAAFAVEPEVSTRRRSLRRGKPTRARRAAAKRKAAAPTRKGKKAKAARGEPLKANHVKPKRERVRKAKSGKPKRGRGRVPKVKSIKRKPKARRRSAMRAKRAGRG
jgi:hypothetical protein